MSESRCESRCVCPSEDPRACVAIRCRGYYVPGGDDDDCDDDGRECECGCHAEYGQDDDSEDEST